MLGAAAANERRRTAAGLCGQLAIACALSLGLSGCYLATYFKRSAKDGTTSDVGSVSGVVGQPLGSTAGGANAAALASLYAIATTHAPAAVRPDPDLYARSLLRQYRTEGSTVARQVGQVAAFSQLLGGASQDFATPPQTTYDATSLLAVSKVAENICRGLVAPDPGTYPGWASILPNAPDQEQANILWLAQRIMGRPSAKIGAETLAQLTSIMITEEPFLTAYPWAQNNPFAKYVAVCAALNLSADSLYF